MIEEHRGHGLAHRLIAAEGKGKIGDADGDLGVRAALLDLPVASMKSTP